jgi:putative acetyltransferase
MITLLRTNAEHPDFLSLVQQLDQELSVHNGETNEFFAKLNTLTKIRHAVVAYLDGEPAGCGAIREFDDQTMEVKRMFVPIGLRGKGTAKAVLDELEAWAAELGFTYTTLETATYLPAAVRLYEKSGYERIPNFGEYVNVPTSICFRKKVK